MKPQNNTLLGSDASMLKPILDAIEYFNESQQELEYFYKIIDKFCVQWFTRPVFVSSFNTVDLLLIHDLLGEYLRFEGNNKKIALWLLSINRVCYNFNADLSEAIEGINEMMEYSDEELDTSLIEPIITNLKELEQKHLNAGVDNNGSSDSIGNFLQWVGLYATFIYPSLTNKTDFYDKSVLKAMNYLLTEFIKQRSNDKRLAFLIMAIIEACKQYSVQNRDVNPQMLKDYAENAEGEVVFAGTEEDMVQELLHKLSDETTRQIKKKKTVFAKEILSDHDLKDSFDNFISDINADPVECVSKFNAYSSELASKFLSLDTGKQFLFLQTLSHYKMNSGQYLSAEVYDNLKKSVSMLSQKTIDWFKTELGRLEDRKDLYIEYILQKIYNESTSTKNNSIKLFMMLYLIKKLELL